MVRNIIKRRRVLEQKTKLVPVVKQEEKAITPIKKQKTAKKKTCK